MKCPASGGTASPVTAPSSASEDEIDIFPSFLLDGQHFLYSRISRTAPDKSGVFVGTLADGPAGQSGKKLLTTGFAAAYVESRNSVFGRVLFMLDGVLYAQQFDDQRLVLVGDRVPVAQPVGSFLDFAFFSVSKTGLLVSKAPDPDTRLTWFERKGHATNTVDVQGPYTDLGLSPDGTRAVVVKHASQSTVDQDLWWFPDVSRNAPPKRLTYGPALEASPAWMQDNDAIIFATGGGGQAGAYTMSVSHAESLRPFLLAPTEHPRVSDGIPTSVSGDVLLSTVRGPMGADVWAYPLGPGPAKGRPFLSDPRDQDDGQLSPDSRWVAYNSNQNGPSQVFVAPVVRDQATGSVSAGPSVWASTGGGASPRWSRRSGELFYLATDGTVMVVPRTGRGFGADATTEVRVPGVLPHWGVSPDGDRFLLAVPVRQPSLFDLRTNWDVGLKR